MSLFALFCVLEGEVKASNMELLLPSSLPSQTFTVPRIPREDAGSLLYGPQTSRLSLVESYSAVL